MSEPTIYEKQLMWKKASAAKAEKLREEHQQATEPTFQPIVYSHPVKQFEGRARDLTEASTQRYVERQNKFRREKAKLSDNSASIDGPADFPKHEEYSEEEQGEYGDGYLNAHYHNTTTNNMDPNTSEDQLESDSMSEESQGDEPIIELLERERKQWQMEREKLIQCIHLQQLELTQRSVASHERAVDIAKEFARAIEAFEERLVSVESNVQREIMSIKSIAESILLATTNGNNNSSNNNMMNVNSGSNIPSKI